MALRATDLEVTPQGDLLYVDQRDDVVQRIRYNVANQPPTAVATSDVTTGPSPLKVNFSGLGSTDPDAGDVLTYAWDLDGDNLLDDSVLPQPTFTYETPGTYTVTLQVTDTRGATSLATVKVTVVDSGIRVLRFAPIADAYVDSANTSRNYGTTAKVRTDGSPKVESLLRFNLAGINGTVQSAKLRLGALADGTADGPELYSAASGWTETGVKWSNRPTFGTAVIGGNKGAIAANSTVEYDVKSLVTGNGELNLGLRQTSSDSAEFGSREDTTAARRPVLEVTYVVPTPDPDPTPTPDPTPGPTPGTGAGPAGGSPFVAVPNLKAPVTGAPTLALVAAGTQRVLKQRGVVVFASCAGPCTLSASAKVSLAGASRSLKLRSIVRNAASGKQVRLRLVLAKKALRSVRRALRRGVKLTATVTVVATDGSGNSSKATRKIRLKR
jgi:PKD repeat protein